MLPATFQTPAAIVLLLGGLLACFAGYRVFRIVLAIYGFILGALVASSFMGTEQTFWMILTWMAGGVAGAIGVAGPITRLNAGNVDAVGEVVREHARRFAHPAST